MKITTVSIGEAYHPQAERLQRSLKDIPVTVINESHPDYTQVNADPLINGLYHKANFANYIEADQNEPILFMDADAFTLKDNPFEDFTIPEGTDIAFVQYKGKWHFPDQIRQQAFDHFGYKINSGFLWFKDLQTAQLVCTAFASEYLKRVELYGNVHNVTKNEYDEYALMIALKDLNLNIHLLDSKWNDWELSTEEEFEASDSVFFQSHDYLDIV